MTEDLVTPSITIEVEATPGYQRTSNTGSRTIQKSRDALLESLDPVVEVGMAVAKKLQAFAENRPEAIEVTFGVKFSASGDVLVAKASAEAQFTVKMTWKPK